ncbi:MAG: hypothetical protein J6U22_01805 [Bacteroidaceae bacterium]|nr:hypothetical protein [Bacteroidaceae bacterium]
MKHLIRLLLLIVVFASVCSIDRSVPDCAIMGKWVGAGGAVLVSILAVSIIALFPHSNKGGRTIGASDMSWTFAIAGMLADNVTHPLNEYALLAVNFRDHFQQMRINA